MRRIQNSSNTKYSRTELYLVRDGTALVGTKQLNHPLKPRNPIRFVNRRRDQLRGCCDALSRSHLALPHFFLQTVWGELAPIVVDVNLRSSSAAAPFSLLRRISLK